MYSWIQGAYDDFTQCIVHLNCPHQFIYLESWYFWLLTDLFECQIQGSIRSRRELFYSTLNFSIEL